MKKLIFIIPVLFILTGCGHLSEEFSCNETATDSCMTIDRVNAMTESREPRQSVTTLSQQEPSNNVSQEVVWIASNIGSK